jgi:hypothetical protein
MSFVLSTSTSPGVWQPLRGGSLGRAEARAALAGHPFNGYGESP